MHFWMIIHTINKQTPIYASGQATWILINIREGMWGGKEGSVMEDKLRTKYFYYMLNKFVQIQKFFFCNCLGNHSKVSLMSI